MKYTSNLNLKKPEYWELADIEDINENMDALDEAVASKADKTQVLTNVPANAKFTDTVTTINGKTGAISKADIVALGIPAQDTVYSHPSNHPASMITESTAKRFVSDSEKSTWNSVANKADKTYVDGELQKYVSLSGNSVISGTKTFSDVLKNNGIENFNDVYVKKALGRANIGTTYANLDSEIKTGGYHRFWKVSFPSGANFWGKVKISLYGGYSSFNASGKMAKEINVNFNGASMYSNVGCYTELSGFVEKDFRISEAIWNSETSQWEFWIYSHQLQGNNTPYIYIEGWAGTNYINTFNGITLNEEPVFLQDTTYENVKGNSAGQNLVKSWTDLPTYQNPYGNTIASLDDLPTNLSNLTKDINFDERYYTETEINNLLSNKVDNSRVLSDVPLNAKFTDTNTTYSEISTTEIDAGTSTTLRTITGRRVKYIIDKVSTMISTAIGQLTKSDIGLGNVDNVQQATKVEFNTHNTDATRHITAAERTSWNTVTGKADLTYVDTELNKKVDKISGKGLSAEDYTSAEKTKLSGIEAGAEVNQNAFSNIKVGTTTIAADSKTDTLELTAGTGITLTPDATNDKVTVSVASAPKLTTARTISLSGDVSGSTSFNGSANVTITATVADDSHNHVISNIDGLQVALDAKETPTGAQTKADSALASAKNYTDTKVAGVVNSAPEALDTLYELAEALGNDPNFATTVMTEIGTKETPGGAQAKVDAHANLTNNPHSVTKSQVGLGSVSNYGLATQAEAEAGTSSAKYMTPLRTKQAINALQAVKSVAGKTGTVTLTKGDVGLSNVDNTSDMDKPISTAVQTALNGKVDNSRVLTDVPANAKFTDTITTINGKTGAISKADIVALGVPAQDTVYSHPSTHPASMITGLPTSLPANGGNSDTVDGKHASDFTPSSHVDDISHLPFVVGTQTTTTASWTGNAPSLKELVNGTTIRYWLPRTSASNVTLELTLADGSSTGAIPCYYSNSTRLSTHYAAGNIIVLTYVNGVTANGTTRSGWYAHSQYNSTYSVITEAELDTGTATTGRLLSAQRIAYMFSKVSDMISIAISNLTKNDVGLGNVTNESKATMFTSPTFTGIPKAPTAAVGTNTTQIATTAFVQNSLSEAGLGDMLKSVYDTNGNGIVDNAEKVNGFTVGTNVPANAKFTDTVTTINGKTGTIVKADIVALGIPAQDTVYTHPSSHPASMITESTSRRFVSDSEKATWNGKANLESPTFTGTPKTTANTSYTTGQLRNIRLYSESETIPALANGEIALIYSMAVMP